MCIREKNSLSRELASARGNEKKQRDNGGITREILIKRVRERHIQGAFPSTREDANSRPFKGGDDERSRRSGTSRDPFFSLSFSSSSHSRVNVCVVRAAVFWL